MKRQLQQFRYYGDGSPKTSNNSQDKTKLKASNLISGSIFPDAIVALGIQTYPGVKFYLNGSDESIIIGSSGLFEIDLNDNCEITLLQFEEESVNFINSPNNTAYLIIDIIYNVKE